MTGPDKHDDETPAPSVPEPEPQLDENVPDGEDVFEPDDDQEAYPLPGYEDDSCR